MEKVIIEINTGNSAFEENNNMEVARILEELADRFKQGNPEIIRDYNGNKVGKVEYE